MRVRRERDRRAGWKWRVRIGSAHKAEKRETEKVKEETDCRRWGTRLAQMKRRGAKVEVWMWLQSDGEVEKGLIHVQNRARERRAC